MDLRRSVSINHYYSLITGFHFFDKDGLLTYKIGGTKNEYLKAEKVLIAENEVIVGVVCKLHPGDQSCFTDF